MLGNVVENVWLQGHLHVDGAGHPHELALSHIEHSVDLVHFISANLCVFVSVMMILRLCLIEAG
jgi:hypothetical protein